MKQSVFQFEFARDVPVPPGTEDLLQRVAVCCLKAEGVSLPCAAYLRFTDDEHIRQLNRDYRQTDRSTDVLSFPSAPLRPALTAGKAESVLRREWEAELGACYLGDIVISMDHVRAQAQEYGHSFTRELAYLTAHALFHLMGYDHMQDHDKEEMRAMEEKALRAAGVIRYDDDLLVAKAKEAMQFSYSPYSKFKVGACLLSADGRMFTGCNIENASFGGTNCAERTALFKAISEGARTFVAIAIAAEKALAWPCGICRQVLNEFAPDLRVIVACGDERDEAPLSSLLPHAFGPSNGTDDYLLERNEK